MAAVEDSLVLGLTTIYGAMVLVIWYFWLNF